MYININWIKLSLKFLFCDVFLERKKKQTISNKFYLIVFTSFHVEILSIQIYFKAGSVVPRIFVLDYLDNSYSCCGVLEIVENSFIIQTDVKRV